MKTTAIFLALALPATASAQFSPQTNPVTPRDVPWFMAHPGMIDPTLRACHSNAAYADLPDCVNANSAAVGLMRRSYQDAVNRSRQNPLLDERNPAFWSANPNARAMTLLQCNRRGPGDDLSYRNCAAAGQSQLNDMRGTR